MKKQIISPELLKKQRTRQDKTLAEENSFKQKENSNGKNNSEKENSKIPESNIKGGRLTFVDSLNELDFTESVPIIPAQRRAPQLENIVPQAPVATEKKEEKTEIRYETGARPIYSTAREIKRDDNAPQTYNPNRKLAVQNDFQRKGPLPENSAVISNQFGFQDRGAMRLMHPELKESKDNMGDYVVEKRAFDTNQRMSATDVIRDNEERKYE